jgi:hypothetical protein
MTLTILTVMWLFDTGIAKPAGWHKFVTWPEGITAWAVILTLAAIAWQSMATARAAVATENAVKTADLAYKLQDATAKRQLRAYMTVKGARLILHNDGTVEPKVELVNCGQTPAYDIAGAYTCRFTTYPCADAGRPAEGTPMSVSIVGAGLSYHILGLIHPSGGDSRGFVVNALSVPDLVFFMKGYYTYRDIFSESHFIEFQMVVGGTSGAPRLDKDKERDELFAVFANDKTGNNAD